MVLHNSVSVPRLQEYMLNKKTKQKPTWIYVYYIKHQWKLKDGKISLEVGVNAVYVIMMSTIYFSVNPPNSQMLIYTEVLFSKTNTVK